MLSPTQQAFLLMISPTKQALLLMMSPTKQALLLMISPTKQALLLIISTIMQAIQTKQAFLLMIFPTKQAFLLKFSPTLLHSFPQTWLNLCVTVQWPKSTSKLLLSHQMNLAHLVVGELWIQPGQSIIVTVIMKNLRPLYL